MSDQPEGKAPVPPRIVLTFDQDTPADATITWEGAVSSGMLYAAAWQLEAYAREVHAAVRAEEARSKLIAARGDPNLLRALGIDLEHDHPAGRRQ